MTENVRPIYNHLHLAGQLSFELALHSGRQRDAETGGMFDYPLGQMREVRRQGFDPSWFQLNSSWIGNSRASDNFPVTRCLFENSSLNLQTRSASSVWHLKDLVILFFKCHRNNFRKILELLNDHQILNSSCQQDSSDSEILKISIVLQWGVWTSAAVNRIKLADF